MYNDLNNLEELQTRDDIIKDIENNIILKDDFDDSTDEALELEKSKRTLLIQPSDINVNSLYDKYDRGKLILQPKYQRKYVMKATTASRLIESMMLDIPIPIIYFAEEADGKWTVIDGQQRLTSIISFIKGKFIYDNKDFKLSGLQVMKEFNGKYFKDLPDDLQEKITDTSIRSYIIKKESNDDIKFEIFERLNTGSTPLNEDEIRNTVYRGEYMDLLKELEENKDFNKIVDKPNFKNRMLYRGMILRFFAFYKSTYLNYKPNMKQFCNKHIKEYRNMDSDMVDEYRKIFKDTISIVYTIFGTNAFRRMKKDAHSNNNLWTKTRINMALYDVQMYGFTRYKKESLIRHADEIRDAMYELMTSNQDFIDAIEIQTSNSDMVTKRFKIWLDKLENIMKQENSSNPRCFSDSVKLQLFNEDSTCKICGQRILNYDDAHVDHINPYSNGGLTNIENAQLTHRFCNQHKSNHL